MSIAQWDIDLSHSHVGFMVRHLVISKVRGEFQKFTSTLAIDPADLSTASVEVAIEASSISTRNDQRDAHLKSPDFFDVEKFPELTFKSTGVKVKGGEDLEIAGDLTIHGVTKPVVLKTELLGQSKDPWGGERIGFSAKTQILRSEFGLTWNQAVETGGVVVSDKVDIEIEIEAVKRKQ